MIATARFGTEITKLLVTVSYLECQNTTHCAIVARLLMKVRHSGTGFRQAPKSRRLRAGWRNEGFVVTPTTADPGVRRQCGARMREEGRDQARVARDPGLVLPVRAVPT